MYSSEHHVGRLVEMRVATPFSEEHLTELLATHTRVLKEAGDQWVVVIDLQRAHVFHSSIVERFIDLMSRVNAALVRSGFLINDSAIFGLQIERAFHQSGDNPNRRCFRSWEELESWLGEVLTPEERIRLRRFLTGTGPVPGLGQSEGGRGAPRLHVS